MLEAFKKLGLSDNTLESLHRKGFEEPTPIQIQIIPLLLEGNTDVIGLAHTGTGKTAAFGLPLIEKLAERSRTVQALILVPTRELAMQVAEEINSLKGRKHLTIVPIYGGQSMGQQLRQLQRGIDIVVGTPGRIKDHLQRGSLVLRDISYLILDEADEMLNMGFIDDIEDIIKYTNQERATMLFSATMPDEILRLARKYMKDYKMIRALKEQLTVNLTDQIYFEVTHYDKLEALCRIIDSEPDFYGLVFCRTKIDVDELSKKLSDRGYDAEALHGDISQNQRERIMEKFKMQRLNVLVATDVAARGIDVQNLTHVINYSLPQDPESYVHRIGRTGRAGKEGTAITFVTPDEYRKLVLIKRLTKAEIRKKKIPEIVDVIKAKKARIKKEIASVIETSAHTEYLDYANELLADFEPNEAITGLIKYTLQNELSTSQYGKIRDVSVDTQGTARLFVARGRSDGMNPRKLVDMIRDIANVDPRRIRDVQIFDRFSFITVPFEDAEIILHSFKESAAHKRPLVSRAREKKDFH